VCTTTVQLASLKLPTNAGMSRAERPGGGRLLRTIQEGSPALAHRLLRDSRRCGNSLETPLNLVGLGHAHVPVEGQRVLPVPAGLFGTTGGPQDVCDAVVGPGVLEAIAGVPGQGEREFMVAPGIGEPSDRS
jgi:hypothetical protein